MNQEELVDMTAMLEDDDFGLDDVAGLEAAALEIEQEGEVEPGFDIVQLLPHPDVQAATSNPRSGRDLLGQRRTGEAKEASHEGPG